MSIGLLFWLLMVLWLISWVSARLLPPQPWTPYADGVLIFVLFFLLGWGVFGAPIRG